MNNFNLKKYLRENKINKKDGIILNTSFLENKDDFKNVIAGNFTAWDPKFKNGLKASQQNFKSSGRPAIPTQGFVYDVVDNEGYILPHINIKFKKSLNEVYIDLDDYDPGEFGVEDFDKFFEILDSKSNPTLQDVYELIDVNNDGLSYYGSYVLDIKPNEIINITRHD